MKQRNQNKETLLEITFKSLNLINTDYVRKGRNKKNFEVQFYTKYTSRGADKL